MDGFNDLRDILFLIALSPLFLFNRFILIAIIEVTFRNCWPVTVILLLLIS